MSSVRATIPRTLTPRVQVLWICVGLFLVRVLGQIEAWLIAPDWLPPMQAWYSGLLPYPVLLPVQIILLMIMAVVAAYEMRAAISVERRWQRGIRIFAVIYFIAMVARLLVQFARGADTWIDAGGIPVLFHWVLALYLFVLGSREARAAPR